MKVFRATNDYVRDQDRMTQRTYVNYVARNLATNTNIEQRQALASLLMQQERRLMMTEVDLPYAATILDGPTVMPQNNVLKITLLKGFVFMLFGSSSWCFATPCRNVSASGAGFGRASESQDQCRRLADLLHRYQRLPDHPDSADRCGHFPRLSDRCFQHAPVLLLGRLVIHRTHAIAIGILLATSLLAAHFSPTPVTAIMAQIAVSLFFRLLF